MTYKRITVVLLQGERQIPFFKDGDLRKRRPGVY